MSPVNVVFKIEGALVKHHVLVGFRIINAYIVSLLVVHYMALPQKLSALSPSQHLMGQCVSVVLSYLISQFSMGNPHFEHHLHFMLCIHHGKSRVWPLAYRKLWGSQGGGWGKDFAGDYSLSFIGTDFHIKALCVTSKLQ